MNFAPTSGLGSNFRIGEQQRELPKFPEISTLRKIGQGGCRVGRRCQICSNTSINIINRALLAARRCPRSTAHVLALGSLHRHRQILGLPTSQAVQRRLAARRDRGSVADQGRGGRRLRVHPIATRRDRRRRQGQGSAVDQRRRTRWSAQPWADTARLAGHHRPADTNVQVNVNTGPNITFIVDQLLAVVDDAATKEKLAARCSTLMACRHRQAPLHLDRFMPLPDPPQ